MWNSSHDLLSTIHEAHGRLKSKETDAITAHAEARLLGAATRVLAISLEHARLTNRLVEGSALLPIMSLGQDEQVTLTVGDNARQIAEATSPS
jgi:hypothetical protein